LGLAYSHLVNSHVRPRQNIAANAEVLSFGSEQQRSGAAVADHRQNFLELIDQLRRYPILRRIVENENS